MTGLLSYGPKNPHEDEQQIARAYKRQIWPVYATMAVIGGAAYFGDLKAVMAVGLICVVGALVNLDARLHDLAIRIRRTNLLLTELRDGRPPDEY